MITNTRTRTRADRLGDGVSLAVLLALGGFAIAVSFSHTMDFVRAHGQTKDWIVVGTACTVVGLTIQSGMEVWRDRRDGRETGWPAALLTIGVLVELWANAAPAEGYMDKVVAAWPVPVAAAALHIWTRRLAAYAAAESSAVPEPVPVVPEPPRNGPEPVDEPAGHPDVDEHQDDVDEHQDELVVDVAALPGETVKEKGAALLLLHPHLSAEEIAAVLGCSDRYGRQIRQEADRRPVDEQVPGQLDGFEQIAAAAA